MDFGVLNAASLRTFGESVTYFPTQGPPLALIAIRQDPLTLEDAAPGVTAAFWFRASDFPNPPRNGDELQLESAVFAVVDIRSRMDGGVMLSVQRRS
jgi:acyl dehydratase